MRQCLLLFHVSPDPAIVVSGGSDLWHNAPSPLSGTHLYRSLIDPLGWKAKLKHLRRRNKVQRKTKKKMDSRHRIMDWIKEHCGYRKNKRQNTLAGEMWLIVPPTLFQGWHHDTTWYYTFTRPMCVIDLSVNNEAATTNIVRAARSLIQLRMTTFFHSSPQLLGWISFLVPVLYP